MLSEKFFDALNYACRLHADQKRKKTNKPYVAHLLGVASIVFEYGGSEEEAIAGLLHDAIEDQGGDDTRREIHRKFGDNITAIVEGCTDADTFPKPPWRERKERYIEHLKTASGSIHMVSAADKLYNIRTILADYRDIGDALWQRFNATKEETLWYYRALVDAFKKAARAPKPLIDELERVVRKVEKMAGHT